MRIEVTYPDAAPRVIETAGESLLSSYVVAGSPEWRGEDLPVMAAMLRPRTDLLMRPGRGLVVELWAWSSLDGGSGEALVSDLGCEVRVPRLSLHAFRAWEVLPPDDVARASAIDIDGRIHVRRIGGRLIDLTCYERAEGLWLSRGEAADLPLGQRVLLLHDRARRAAPGTTDAEVGASYGLGTLLFDWALSQGGDAMPEGNARPRDGLDGAVDTLAACQDREALVSAMQDAILDLPDLTPASLALAVARHGLDLDVDDLWTEAEGRLMDDSAWDEGE